MERLRCQSPVMAQKELLACLVAHNLVRALMAQAAARHEACLERISFKGALVRCANTAQHWVKRAAKKCEGSCGTIYCSI